MIRRLQNNYSSYEFIRPVNGILFVPYSLHTGFAMNKNQSFNSCLLQRFGLQTGAEFGQHPTLPPGLTSKLLKGTFTRIKSSVGSALQHIRLSGLADVDK